MCRFLAFCLCVCLAVLAFVAPAEAGGGLFHRSVVVQRQVIRQPVVRQRVVVQQQIVAQPVVVQQQQFYAQPIVSQQIIAQPLQFYSQPLVSQQFVQPSCGQQLIAPQQFRQSISGGGCSSFFAR